VSFTRPNPPGTPVYANPIGSGLTPERVDMGVDYGGHGSLFALGSGVITSIYNSGWPGGTFIGLHLDTGQYMYYAENIMPHVQVGQRVTAGQLVGTATGGPSGIEVGWAAPPGTGGTMAAQAGQAAKGSDPGEFPTAYGVSMSNLIASLGGPPGIISGPITGGIPASQAPLYGSGVAGGAAPSGTATGCVPLIYSIYVFWRLLCHVASIRVGNDARATRQKAGKNQSAKSGGSASDETAIG
jgi:hypothetical protein